MNNSGAYLLLIAFRNRIDGPHPEEPCAARRLEGWPLTQLRPWPSFETPTFGRLLRTRLMDGIDMIRALKTLY
jgi:hypothetical protein